MYNVGTKAVQAVQAVERLSNMGVSDVEGDRPTSSTGRPTFAISYASRYSLEIIEIATP